MKKRHTYALPLKFTAFVIVLFTALPGCSNRQVPVGPSDGDNTSGPTTLNGGSISGSLTFRLSPYIVKGSLWVDTLKTLNIEPGVIVKFEDSAGLYIKGQLNCIGRVDNPILFTSNNLKWKGIVISTAPASAQIQFAIFEKIAFTAQTDPDRNGAIEIAGTKVTIRNSIFRNNKAVNGGALYLSSSTSVITNNIFINNFAANYGGAVLSSGSSNQFINNIFSTNEGFNFGGGIVLVSPMLDDIQNNIFYNNTGKTGDPSVAVMGLLTDSSRYIIKYNYLRTTSSGPGFVSQQDLHLSFGSPCINSGNPDPKYNDVNGTRNDQGAFGGPYGSW